MASELRMLADAVREVRAARATNSPDVDMWDVEAAERELCDAILSSNAVDVVEAVRALGSARAREAEVLNQMQPSDIAVRCARDGVDVAERAVARLADRLAAEGGEG